MAPGNPCSDAHLWAETYSMLRAGLIDEVSLLVAPVADGRVGTPTLFDVDAEGLAPRRLTLEGFGRRAGDVAWLRYRAVAS